MKVVKRYKPLENKNLESLVFVFCWIAYFSTYIGRLNYSAAMTQMIQDNVLSNIQGGIIGTAFFACYGVGQFINGFIGDKVSPFRMVFIGIFVSAVCNLFMTFSKDLFTMTFFWGLNGLCQSMVWSPILRIFSQVISNERRYKACVHINTTVPAGTIFTYLLSTLILSLKSWREVFFIAFIVLLCVSIFWGVFFNWKKSNFILENVNDTAHEQYPKSGLSRIFYTSGLLVLLFPAALHGMLKDGVTHWFPTYLMESYKLQSNISVLFTTLLPIVNLLGAYVASGISKRRKIDEIKTTSIMFAISCISLAMLLLFGRYSMYLSVIFAACATSCMFGINTMIISILPMNFGKLGLASTVSGILNSATYIGCAVSMSLFGGISQKYSWIATILLWVAISIVGTVSCMIISHRWNAYKNKQL